MPQRPKACFLYYQGFGQLLHREAMTLKKGGFDVDIICLKSRPDEPFRQSYDGLDLYRLHYRGSAEKTVAGYLKGLMLFLVKAAALMTALAPFRRYAVVHVTSPPDFAVFTTLLPKLFGAKVILDIHDISPELYMRKLDVDERHPVIRFLKWLEKLSAGYADHVITVTDIWRDKLASRSVPAEKTSVLLNVPDQELFRFNPRAPVRGEMPLKLYYHGSMEEHFGVDTMLQAMPLIRSRVPAVLHIYAGKKGRLNDHFIAYAKEHGMEEYVTFHDAVPFHRLPEVLADADIGVVPTKNSTFADEAVSMKSLEYLFLGIPVVISGTTAHRYYYDDSMVQFFTPCDSTSLADAVVRLHRDAERRKEMLDNSVRFLDCYGWNKAGAAYRKTVTDLVRAV